MRKEASLSREIVIKELVSRIKDISSSGTTRVAIDGLMASGKTRLAQEISASLESENVVVLQASADDFFNAEEIRYSRGFESARGCYDDTFDPECIKTYLLMRDQTILLWRYLVSLVSQIMKSIAARRRKIRSAKQQWNIMTKLNVS
jgi:hypothetical protein